MVGQAQTQLWISPEEYLAIERRATYRSEYVHGEMFAMAGASRQHNRISSNLVSAIDQHIIEILSDSTAAFDPGKKFEQYRELPSFVEYLLVDQRTPRIEQYILHAEKEWRYRDIRGFDDAVVTIQALECPLAFRDIYHKVDIFQHPFHHKKK